MNVWNFWSGSFLGFCLLLVWSWWPRFAFLFNTISWRLTLLCSVEDKNILKYLPRCIRYNLFTNSTTSSVSIISRKIGQNQEGENLFLTLGSVWARLPLQRRECCLVSRIISSRVTCQSRAHAHTSGPRGTSGDSHHSTKYHMPERERNRSNSIKQYDENDKSLMEKFSLQQFWS